MLIPTTRKESSQDLPKSTPQKGSDGSPVTGLAEPKLLIPTTVDLSEVSLTAAEADKLRVRDWNNIVDAVRVMCKEQMPSPQESPDKPVLGML